MSQRKNKKVYYHLPGLFEFYELYCAFLPLYKEHREYFYDWCEISSIYGSPADCLWGGGRAGFGSDNPEEVLKLTQENGISARLTFSNRLLRKEHFIGLEMTTSGIVNDKFLVNTPGEFSAYNSACAILTTSLLGCNINSIKNALSQVAVRGRVEIVPVSNKYTVIIDYAHNGVSTKSILTTMRKYNPKRIVSLFGCGGNRSKDRRYDMWEVSGKYADLSIITEDNSRYEDVNDIMNDIEVGIKKTNGKYIKIPDRREAIKYAIDNAKEGDIILILGKGHETYQEKNGERTHFDDREEVLKLFK